MRPSDLLLLSFGLPLAQAAETILGAYIFSRHGDRTPKSLPPASLTDLGYQQIFTSGNYFRDRYVSSSATAKIAGLNSDLVKQSQIAVSAPLDTILMNSAQGFLQGLYPPVGPNLASNKLRNGTVVQAPMNGYQLIPVQQVASGTASEDSAWLQGVSNCARATVSSNEYFQSEEYKQLLESTVDFYKTLTPVINGTFTGDQISYKNAYTSESCFEELAYMTSTDSASLRYTQRCIHPQCHHKLFGASDRRCPVPSSRSRQSSRMGPFLQRLGRDSRGIRSRPRSRGRPRPQQHPDWGRKDQIQHSVWRIRNLSILLRPRRTPCRKHRFLRHPRLRLDHDLRALHNRTRDALPHRR